MSNLITLKAKPLPTNTRMKFLDSEIAGLDKKIKSISENLVKLDAQLEHLKTRAFVLSMKEYKKMLLEQKVYKSMVEAFLKAKDAYTQEYNNFGLKGKTCVIINFRKKENSPT